MDFEISKQMLNPKIRIISSSKIVEYGVNEYALNQKKHSQDYIEIGGRIEPSSKFYLLGYNYSESVNNFSGNFSVSIYEDIDIGDAKSIFARVNNLDVVLIYENSEKDENDVEKNDPVFIGVVHSKNTKSMINNGKVNRITTIDGNGICSLVGDLSLSLDIHTLTGIQASEVQKEFTSKISSMTKYSSIVMELYNAFKEISEKIAKNGGATTQLFIDKMLASFYAGGGSAKNFFQFGSLDDLKYPVVASFWVQSVNSFADMLRTLLPSNIFEIFGTIKNGKPILNIREMPFESTEWNKLPISTIDPLYLTGYSISQSDSEIYNAFLAYIEGSAEDTSKYLTLSAINHEVETNADKISKYGYRPLQVTFRGYDNSQDFGEESAKKAIKGCISKLKNWYGDLDELYSGTINLVRGEGDTNPKIGERIKFINFEFYVTDKSHNWRYGSPVNVTLNVSRGAAYNKNGVRDKKSNSKAKFGSRYAEIKTYK